METQRQEFRIGIMVLACLVSLTLMIVFFGKRPLSNLSGGGEAIHVRFERAPGIKPNSPVLKNGVQIGRVARVELVNQDQQVEVTINLERGRKIYSNEECRVRQHVIMADATLEFAKRRNFSGDIVEINADSVPYLVGVDSTDLMSGFGNIEGDLTKAVQNVADAADHMGSFIERLNTIIGTPEEFSVKQANFESVIQETRQTMASMRQTTDGISQIVNDPAVQSNVRRVIGDLPEIIEHSRILVGESTLFVQDARELVEKGKLSIDTLSTSLEKVTRTLDAVTNIAVQVEGEVPEIVSAVKRSAVRLEALFNELTLIVENFRNADGTVKRLIRDPEVYEKVLATLDNVEKITDEVDWMLRVEARPIAHNVKILTDKAARDPSVFIRNLLVKDPPIKPIPYWFGRGKYLTAAPLFPPISVIKNEVVEVMDEEPVYADQSYVEPSYMNQPYVHHTPSMPLSVERDSEVSLPVTPLSPPALKRSVIKESIAHQTHSQNVLETPQFYDETPEQILKEGRILNVDPRYPEF